MTARLLFTAFCFAVPVAVAPLSLHAEGGFVPDFTFPVLGAEALPASFDSYHLPIAPWQNGTLPVEVFEGQVDRRAFRLDSGGASLLEVIAPLRAQIAAAGYEVIFDCEARRCGGFDFRFATDVLAEPEMHVDLNDFRFLAARRGDEAMSLLVSRSGGAGFVQIITVGHEALPAPTEVPSFAAPLPNQAAPVEETSAGATTGQFSGPLPPRGSERDTGREEGAGMLDLGQPFALDDLDFATGSASLTDRDYASLRDLAEWLSADPARHVILVGHTDISGPLEGNIALSKRRAEAARAMLIQDFHIAANRITAQGVGPLAPRADNGSEEGRQKNRRVEAIPAPT